MSTKVCKKETLTGKIFLMKVKQLIYILSLMDQESDVFIRLNGKWEGVSENIDFSEIEFTGYDIRVEDTGYKIVTIYADLKEINQI